MLADYEQVTLILDEPLRCGDEPLHYIAPTEEAELADVAARKAGSNSAVNVSEEHVAGRDAPTSTMKAKL